MKKAKRVRSYFLLTLALFLLFGQFNLVPFHALAEGNSNKDISYEVQKELSRDKKKATIKIKAIPQNEQVTMLTVETPDGKKTEGEEATYIAEKNGVIDFTITYQNADDVETTETQTFHASYEVSGIVSEDEINKGNRRGSRLQGYK